MIVLIEGSLDWMFDERFAKNLVKNLMWIKGVQTILKPPYHEDFAGYLVFKITDVRMKFKIYSVISSKLRYTD